MNGGTRAFQAGPHLWYIQPSPTGQPPAQQYRVKLSSFPRENHANYLKIFENSLLKAETEATFCEEQKTFRLGIPM